MFSGQRRISIDSANQHFLTKLWVTATTNNENQSQVSSVRADFSISRAILLTLALALVTYSLFTLFPSAALAEPPVADAGENQSVTKNNLLSSDVTLDGTESYDIDGDPFVHEWYGPFGMAIGTTPSVIVPQGTYTVSLQAVGCPESSEIDSVEVKVAPAFIITPRTKRGKIQLTWTHIPGTLRYDIYRTTANEPFSFAKIADTASTYSTYLDYDVVNETSYLYAVAAISNTGVTGYSNIVSSCPPESRSTARLNRQPIIYSQPVTQASLGFPYEYTVLAADPNNNTLIYSLDTYPEGMTIDSITGKISWIPVETGEVEVTVNVNDGNGLSDSQSYLITVITLPPTVTLTASPTTIYFGGDGSGGDGEPLSDSGGKGSEEYSVRFVLAQGVDYVKNIAKKFIFAKPAVAAPDEGGEGGGSGYGGQDYSTLNWCATKAEYCIIEPGIGTVEPSGTIDVQPGETTTYTITAYGPGGTATASETVTVIYLPPTVDLTAEPMVVDYRPHYDNTDGYSQWGYDEQVIPVDLSWSSINATTAEIQDIGSVSPYGWMQVEPEETTTYTITVTGPGGTATDEVTVTVIYPEPPLSFQASPEEIMVGTTTHLVWDTAFADSVTITPDIGTVAKDGSVGVAPEQTTTYTITATGPGGTSMATTTVHVNYPPPPTEFTGSPQVLNEPGDTATLSWSTSWADNCSIEPGIGPVSVNGSLQVTPFETTTYTLTAIGPGGTTTKTVTISFPLPFINLSADPDILPLNGTATLTWNTVLADSCTITPDIGNVPVNGSIQVSPSGPTTYTLTAVGPGGTATASVDVDFVQPTATISASPQTITTFEESTLSWTSIDAVTCTIEPDIGSVAVNGQVAVSPDETTTYTLTSSGPGGTKITQATVNVLPLPIVTLTTDNSSIPYGNSVTLNWNSIHADTCSIEPDIGVVDVSGTVVVTPLQTTTYTVTATGPGGATTSTVTVNVASPITLTITSPGSGAMFTGVDVMVTGEFSNQTGLETGITVNGVLALVDGNRFVVNHVSPLPDTNAITVKAVDTEGFTVEETVIVNPQPAERFITLNVDTASGAAPLETTLRIGTSLLPLELQGISDQGPGAVEYLEVDGNGHRIRLTEKGIYTFTTQATDEENNTYTDTVAVQVLDRDELDTRLQTKWETMKTAMASGDVEEAAQFFAINNQDVFRQQFTALSTMLPAIVTDMENCTLVDIQENRAVYDLRTVRNGETYSFQVLFARDRDGIWRIVNF